jgi:hypothetical protein
MALMFWRRRAAMQRGLQLGLGAVVLVGTLGASLTIGYASRQPDSAVRAAWAATSAADGSMVYVRQAASDGAAQDASVRARLRHAVAGVAVAIAATTIGDPVQLDASRLTALPLRDDAELRASVHGLSELGSGEAAIDADGARALKVAVGDTIRVQTDAGVRPLRVAAIWTAVDPRAAIWNGIGPGTSGTGARLVLAAAELRADGVALTTRWSTAPDVARLRASQLAVLDAGWRRLQDQARVATTLTRFEGGGIDTVTRLRDGIAAARAVVPVPLALLAGAGVLAFFLLLRLRAELAGEETALLRARGASRAQLVRGDLGAAAPWVVLGAVVGWLVAQGVLWWIVGPPLSVVDPLVPLLVPVVFALALVPTASLSADASAEVASGRRDRRLRAATTGAVVLLVAVAVLSQLRLVGAGVGSDPASELAPALIVVAVVIVGLVAGRPAARTADRLVRDRDGFALPLAARRLRHRPGLLAGSVVLVSLAVATCGFAAATTASSSSFVRDAGRLTTGGDLSVLAPNPSRAATLARTTGVTASAPAVVQQLVLGDLPAALAAAPVASIGAFQDASLADLPALSRTAVPLPGVLLPRASGAGLTVQVTSASAPDGATVDLTGWFVRSDGAAVGVDLGSAPVGPGTFATTLQARLPAIADWHWVGIDADVQSRSAVTGLEVRVTALSLVSSGASHPVAMPSSAWARVDAITPPLGIGQLGVIGWSAGLPLNPDGGLAQLGRLMPHGSAVVPVAMSRPLATTAGLQLGDRTDLGSAPGATIRLVAVVPHVIGTNSAAGIWADLPTLQLATLRTDPRGVVADRIWLSSRAPEAVATRVSTSDPAAQITPAPALVGETLARPAVVGLVVGAAGSLIFALVGIMTGVAGLLRTRRAETAVLRALGADPASQLAAERWELLAALLFGIVVGVTAAAAVMILTVPGIAHAADTAAGPELRAGIHLDPVLGGAATIILALGLIGALVVQNRVVRRAASAPSDTEFER